MMTDFLAICKKTFKKACAPLTLCCFKSGLKSEDIQVFLNRTTGLSRDLLNDMLGSARHFKNIRHTGS